MENVRKPASAAETKIFDPRDASTASGGAELLDASVVKRTDGWWMYLAGQAGGIGTTDIYSASLPAGALLSVTGWKPTRSIAGELAPVAERRRSSAWDGKGSALPVIHKRVGFAQRRLGRTHLLCGRG